MFGTWQHRLITLALTGALATVACSGNDSTAPTPPPSAPTGLTAAQLTLTSVRVT